MRVVGNCEYPLETHPSQEGLKLTVNIIHWLNRNAPLETHPSQEGLKLGGRLIVRSFEIPLETHPSQEGLKREWRRLHFFQATASRNTSIIRRIETAFRQIGR